MVGQIVFAWQSSSGLDARCKQWRLFADVLNDAAICLELAAPALGAGVFKVSLPSLVLSLHVHTHQSPDGTKRQLTPPHPLGPDRSPLQSRPVQ